MPLTEHTIKSIQDSCIEKSNKGNLGLWLTTILLLSDIAWNLHLIRKQKEV